MLLIVGHCLTLPPMNCLYLPAGAAGERCACAFCSTAAVTVRRHTQLSRQQSHVCRAMTCKLLLHMYAWTRCTGRPGGDRRWRWASRAARHGIGQVYAGKKSRQNSGEGAGDTVRSGRHRGVARWVTVVDLRVLRCMSRRYDKLRRSPLRLFCLEAMPPPSWLIASCE